MNACARGAKGTFILYLLNSAGANFTGCSVYVFGSDGFRSEKHLKRCIGLNQSVLIRNKHTNVSKTGENG